VLFKKKKTSSETLLAWLAAIKMHDIEEVEVHTQKTWLSNHFIQSHMRGILALGITQYKIVAIIPISPVMHRFRVSIRHRLGVAKIELIATRERKAYKPARFFGGWGVNPASWKAIK